MTYIVYNHTYMSSASLLISFTCLVIEFCKGRHNVGQIIETACNTLKLTDTKVYIIAIKVED